MTDSRSHYSSKTNQYKKMKKKLIKITTLALASAFAFAPLAIADDEEGGKKKRPERGERGGDRPERGGPGGIDREAFMKEFDKDRDGKLNEKERGKAREKMMERGKERSKEMFKKQDADSNGTLSLEEFTAGPGNENEERAKKFFTKADANSDGELSMEEMGAARRARGPRGGGADRPGRGGDRPEGKRPEGGRGKGGEGKGKGKTRPAADEEDQG
ncbi:MAG: hypothetical protein ACI9NC_003365 [Verrucomicrobiales bacterium]